MGVLPPKRMSITYFRRRDRERERENKRKKNRGRGVRKFAKAEPWTEKDSVDSEEVPGGEVPSRGDPRT